MSDKKSLFLKCNCTGHALEITKWDDEQDFEISIWNRFRDHLLCFNERIRWCWRIIKTGNPWADEVILSAEDALKLSDFIIEKSIVKDLEKE